MNKFLSAKFINFDVYVYILHQLNHANAKPDIVTFDNTEHAIDLVHLHSFFQCHNSYSFNGLFSFVCKYLVTRSRSVSQIRVRGTKFQHLRVFIKLPAN